jgi:hypothetical protein
MVIKKVVQSEEPEQQLKQNYKQISIINKPKSGGLMTDRFRVKDIIQQENKEEQSQVENIARETIGNRLIALNYKRDLLNELNLRKEIPTNAGEKQTVRTVLEQALTGMRDKLEAKKELERKKLLKSIENEAKLNNISTSQDKIRIKNIYASVVQDATNSALSRLVELDGKQYIAQHLATESPKVKFNNGIERIMTRHVWESDKIPGIGVSQIPLILSWALTIHKSQGASIDYLELDLGDDIFISGQLYTALSRATNINNIKIVNLSKLSFMQNKKVIEFYS